MYQQNNTTRLNQIRDLIKKVLEDKKQPMHVKEIAKRVQELNKTVSYPNVATNLSRHTATFVRVSTFKQPRGLWGLRSWTA